MNEDFAFLRKYNDLMILDYDTFEFKVINRPASPEGSKNLANSPDDKENQGNQDYLLGKRPSPFSIDEPIVPARPENYDNPSLDQPEELESQNCILPRIEPPRTIRQGVFFVDGWSNYICKCLTC
jgi:hypothetical protein